VLPTLDKKEFDILYAEDDVLARNLLIKYIKDNSYPYSITLADSFKAAENVLKEKKFDVILADYYLGDGIAIDLMSKTKDTPFIVITGAGDEEIAINTMKAGAYDYLVKTPQLTHLMKLHITIENAVYRRFVDSLLNMHSQAIQNITDSVFFINARNEFIYVNESFCNTYKFSKEDILGRNIGIIWESNTNFTKFFDKKFSGEYYNRKKDGEIFPVSLSYSPITNKNNIIIASVGIARDITEQRKTQTELKQYSERLEKLVEERTKELREFERFATIGETATMVGHDLRNPLQVLVNTVFLSKMKLDNNQDLVFHKEEISKTFSVIREQIDYMNKIVSDLQFYGKNLKPELRPVNLQEFINKIITESTNYSNVNYSIDIAQEVNNMNFDIGLMQRVFINLFSNAQNAFKGKGKISFKANRINGKVRILVEDNGEGIPESVKPNLFKPLYTTKAKGTGLGLSVCKRIVESHNGTIEIESTLGKGTKIIINLPQ
jgi:PAS domain S-box-containing protein